MVVFCEVTYFSLLPAIYWLSELNHFFLCFVSHLINYSTDDSTQGSSDYWSDLGSNSGLNIFLVCGGGLVTKSYPTLATPMNCSLPGSSVHEISPERILEGVVISFSRESSQPRDQTCISFIAGRFFTNWATKKALFLSMKVKMKSISRVWLFVTPWTVAHQAPPSMGFSRQEYWSWLPFPSPRDFPETGIEPRSPALQADTLTSEPLLLFLSIGWNKTLNLSVLQVPLLRTRVNDLFTTSV